MADFSICRINPLFFSSSLFLILAIHFLTINIEENRSPPVMILNLSENLHHAIFIIGIRNMLCNGFQIRMRIFHGIAFLAALHQRIVIEIISKSHGIFLEMCSSS